MCVRLQLRYAWVRWGPRRSGPRLPEEIFGLNTLPLIQRRQQAATQQRDGILQFDLPCHAARLPPHGGPFQQEARGDPSSKSDCKASNSLSARGASARDTESVAAVGTRTLL